MLIEYQDGAWHNSKYIMNLEIICDLFESSILATDINNNIIELFKFTGVSAESDAKSKLRDIMHYISREKHVIDKDGDVI